MMRYVILLASTGVILATLSALSQSEPTLPPAAQEAFERGKQAAALQNFRLATQHFEEARRYAPLSPEVLFNQGLAETKAGGRDLRAIVLFNAYLAIEPRAPDAGAVRKQILSLEAAVENAVEKLVALIPPSAIPSTTDDPIKSLFDDSRLITYLFALTGDISRAKRVQPRDQHEIPKAQAMRKDFTGAVETARTLPPNMWQGAYSDIVVQQAVLDPDRAYSVLKMIQASLDQKCCYADALKYWAAATAEQMRGYLKRGQADKAVAVAREMMPYVRKWQQRYYPDLNEMKRDESDELWVTYHNLSYLVTVAGRPPRDVLGRLPENVLSQAEMNSAHLDSADIHLQRRNVRLAKEALSRLINPASDQRRTRESLLRLAQNENAQNDAEKANKARVWTTFLDDTLIDYTSYEVDTSQASSEKEVVGRVRGRAADLMEKLLFIRKLPLVRSCTLAGPCRNW